ncbi:MAG: hypothetical protein ABSG19_02555 [Candidatus Aminicenantales bacterium]
MSSGSRPGARLLQAGRIVVCSILLSGLFSSNPGTARGLTRLGPGPGSPDPELSSILERAAQYCDKLNRSVLNFVCRERIEEWFRHAAPPASFSYGNRIVFLSSPEKFQYVYDYQLIRERGGSIRETRTLLKENGKDVQVSDAPLKTHSFWHTNVVMGPLGLLSRERQADHDYRILREAKIGGDPVLVIEVVPKPDVRLEDLFGTVWLRKKDAGILKIEWNPSSIRNYKGVEETAKQLGLIPSLLVTSEYAFEQNGIRFPSRYTLRELYRRGKSGARYQRSETDVVYDQYKFFMVETKVEFGK